MMNIESLAVPAFVALSLVFTGCAGSQIEAPDAVDGAVQDGIEGVEEGASEAGDAVNGGLDNIKQGAEDATGAAKEGAKDLGKDIEGAADSATEGAKDLGKDIEGAAGSAKDNVQQGLDDAGNKVENWDNKAPSNEVEAD